MALINKVQKRPINDLELLIIDRERIPPNLII
jgi:hypothetical protein